MASGPTIVHKHVDNPPNRPRRFLRQRIGPLVYLELGDCNGGFPINVSEEGLSFQGIQPLQKDQLLAVKFKLPDLDSFVETSGKVIWINEIRTGGGLRFVDLPDASRLLIKNWISSENRSVNSQTRLQTGIEAKAKRRVAANVEKTEPVPPVSVAPQDIELASSINSSPECAHVTEDMVSVETAPEKSPIAARNSPPLSVARPELIPNIFAGSSFLRPTDVTLQPANSDRLTEPGKTRSWFDFRTFVLIVSASVIAAVGLFLLESRPRSWSGEIKTSANSPAESPVTDSQLPPAQVETGSQPASQDTVSTLLSQPSSSATNHLPMPSALASESVAENSQPDFKDTPRSDTTGIQGNTAVSAKMKKSVSIPKGLPPVTVASSTVGEIAPPTIAPSAPSESVRALPMVLPAPPPPAANHPIEHAFDELEPARLLVRKEPVYPSIAKTARFSGTVNLLFTIGADGKVSNVRVVNGSNFLIQAAVDAVKAWRFQPARHNGNAVDSESNTAVVFKLN